MYSSLGKKISNDQFDIKIKDSSFIRISNYINTHTSIEFQCKKCEKVFKKKPKEFNKLKCNCGVRKENYTKSIESKNILLIDDYSNCRKKLLHKCLKCENTFISSPKIIKNSKYGCPYCAGVRISIVDYNKRLPKNIIAVESYINSYTKIKHKCLDCENIWETKPNYILHMLCNCPFCSSSKGEKSISNLLNELNIKFEREKEVNIDNNKYFFDFYLPELNIIIEYDGIQHFEPVDYFGGIDNYELVKKNDYVKNKWCFDNKILLIRIPYYNFDDIDFILIDLLKRIL